MADTCEIYLIRHAVAEERGAAWPDDNKRPLTSDGVSRMRKAARGLAELGVVFDVVFTSPLVRAKQTADIVANAFDEKPAIVVLESLSPGGTFQAVMDDLERHRRCERIALVGHEPGIGHLAARLIGAKTPLEFKKGAVCRIDTTSLPPDGPGVLRWFATPKLLRMVK